MSETGGSGGSEYDPESDDVPVSPRDGPRFASVSTRREVAIAKYYGMGSDDESWSIERIADYLRVSERTVRDYIYESEMGEDVERRLAEKQSRTRMKVAMDLLESMEEIDELIAEASEEKRPAVVSYRYEDVVGDMELDYDELNVEMEDGQAKVPIPDQWKEVTKTGALKDLWEEKRQLIEQIEGLLGLDAPDQIESQHTEVVHEEKVWKVDNDSLPDQTVSQEGEKQRSDEVIDVDNTVPDENDSPIDGKD